MPLVTLSMGSDPKDPAPLPEAVPPAEIYLAPEVAGDLWSFLTCLATKTDVLLPALLAIIACAKVPNVGK